MKDTVKTATVADAELGGFDRFLRGQLLGQMAQLKHGRLLLKDVSGEVALGEPASAHPALVVHIDVLDPGFYRAVAMNGSVGAGEAWIDGLWRCVNLVGLIQLLVRNRDMLDGMESGLARLGGLAMRGWHALRRNTLAGSRKNIAAHYDLGNDFFELFLSPDLMYSSAIWTDPEDSLEIASERKLERICRKLDLKPTDHVVEIGTGWGGFALYAARN
jgi:cyclopropane-fatty-acyl-phospholipid synthase